MRNTLKVGELLMHAGVIDQAQLTAALAEQQRWGRRIGVTLIKMGLVEENHLIRALAQQLGLPATSLIGRRIAWEVIALVPARIAAEHSVIPLFVKRNGGGGKLFLGMEDPSKIEVLDDLCFRTGLEIQPVMMGPTELAQAIDRYYGNRKGARSPGARDSGVGETTMGERNLGLSDSSPAVPATPRALAPAPDGDSTGDLEESGSPAKSTAPIPRDAEGALDAAGSRLPGHLINEINAAVHDTEKTRLVVKAITQILVEKQILTLDEIQSRIAKLKAGDSRG
jgi:MshEN domain